MTCPYLSVCECYQQKTYTCSALGCVHVYFPDSRMWSITARLYGHHLSVHIHLIQITYRFWHGYPNTLVYYVFSTPRDISLLRCLISGEEIHWQSRHCNHGKPGSWSMISHFEKCLGVTFKLTCYCHKSSPSQSKVCCSSMSISCWKMVPVPSKERLVAHTKIGRWKTCNSLNDSLIYPVWDRYSSVPWLILQTSVVARARQCQTRSRIFTPHLHCGWLEPVTWNIHCYLQRCTLSGNWNWKHI